MRKHFVPQLVAFNRTPPAELPEVMPDSPEALADFLADDDRMVSIFGNAESRAEFLAAYNRITNSGDHVARQVTEQVTDSVMEFLQANGATDRLDMTEVADRMSNQVVSEIHRAQLADQPLNVYNPGAMGAELDDVFTNTADFFSTIWHNADHTDPENIRRLTAARNAFSESVPSEGGFLVPERLRSELLRLSLEQAIVRPRARVVPMDSARVPFPAVDETSHASSVFGGIVAYWTEEGGTLTDSTPKFRRVVLEALKLTLYTYAPNELISDSAVSFQSFIDEVFPEALTYYEDVAFIDGSGAGEPKGFLNADAAVTVAKETGQTAATIVWENIVKMYARMLPSSHGRAVWVVNQDTFPELATMALSVGTGGAPIWLNNGQVGPPAAILGRPVILTEKVETLGTAGDINYVDLGFYLVGDRQAMSARSSEHARFTTDETAFRIIQRVDGKPWLNSAITPKKGANTVSPYVKLATRS